MASECGCHSDYIENGFVATGACKVYSSSCDIYCPFYCHSGYVKNDASSVYCAGNERWIPTGSHPSENKKACRKDTEAPDVCDIFLENGYIVSCPTPQTSSRKECLYRCYNGYRPTSKTVYCTKDGWVPTNNDSKACIKDGSRTTPFTKMPTTTAMFPTAPRTTYRGYYDDPNLKMDVSPVIFVGAVIGGILILGLLVFAIFFRAHKKSSREVRRRTAFIAVCDPLSQQNDYTNHQDSRPTDDSEYRDIARRIIDQSTSQQQQQQQQQRQQQQQQLQQQQLQQQTLSTPPPYTAVHNLGTSSHDTVPYQSFDNLQRSQTDGNTNAIDRNIQGGPYELADKPPPYESLDNEIRREPHTQVPCNQTSVTDEELDPPPPYTTHDGLV